MTDVEHVHRFQGPTRVCAHLGCERQAPEWLVGDGAATGSGRGAARPAVALWVLVGGALLAVLVWLAHTGGNVIDPGGSSIVHTTVSPAPLPPPSATATSSVAPDRPAAPAE